MSGILFLGAGFSKWAGGLPLVSSLFDFKINVRNETEKRRIEKLQKIKAKWDKENEPNNELFLQAIQSKKRIFGLACWYITRRLTDEFLIYNINGLQTLQIDESRKLDFDSIKRVKMFLSWAKPLSLETIITTNYDLLIEYALGTSGFKYTQDIHQLSGRGNNPYFPWQRSYPQLLGEIKLYKMHGSLSWDNKGKYYTDSRCGLKGNALILAPLEGKVPYKQLKLIWQEASEELQKSNFIIFFGFSFNSIDTNVLEILQMNLGKTIKIIVIDVVFRRKYIQELFPKNKIIFFRPPTELNQESIDILFKKIKKTLSKPQR